MKKVVRMLGLCALVALAFTSCNKKDDTNKVTFKATMPQTVSNDRTYITENNALYWSENDMIKVLHNGVDEDFQIMPGEESQKTATFDATGKGEFLSDLLTNDSVYFAFYPNAVPAGDGATVTVSDEQHRFYSEVYPMFATNVADNFRFNSNAGILRIQLRKAASAAESTVTVGSIELTSADPNDQLVGEVTYDNTYVLNPTPSLPVSNFKNHVTLICDTPEVLATGQDPNQPMSYPVYTFDFVLFEGALEGAFNVKVRDAEGVLIGNFDANPSTVTVNELNHTIERKVITVMPAKSLTGEIIPE